MDLKTRIEKALSEILSDKYDCKITLHFEKKEGNNEARNKADTGTKKTVA